jgi:hypothetical protein
MAAVERMRRRHRSDPLHNKSIGPLSASRGNSKSSVGNSDPTRFKQDTRSGSRGALEINSLDS